MRILFLFTFLLSFLGSTAQKDSVILLSGKVIKGEVIQADEETVQFKSYDHPRKGLINEPFNLESHQVFSVYNNGEESILYKKDSTVGFFWNQSQMKSFVLGEYHALNYYKPKFTNYLGAAMGLGITLYDTYLFPKNAANSDKTGFFQQDLGMAPFLGAFVYTVSIGLPKAKIKETQISDRTLLLDPYFLSGYHKSSRSRRVGQGFLYYMGGVGVGILAHTFSRM
jgi:hypothetical protein